MKVRGQHYRTIWPDETGAGLIHLIDQRFLPHRFVIEEVRTVDEMATAIKEMHVRGAGLIGAAAGYGMYLATLGAEGHSIDDQLAAAAQQLRATRPTAVNLAWAIERQLKSIRTAEDVAEKRRLAFETARQIADEDAEYCRRIGEHGLALIRRLSRKKAAHRSMC